MKQWYFAVNRHDKRSAVCRQVWVRADRAPAETWETRRFVYWVLLEVEPRLKRVR
jgi:hypothetical protein